MKRFLAPVFALLFASAAHAQSGLLPANQVWAGPPSGGQGFARARALVAADLPALSFGSFSLASGQIVVGQVSGFAGAVAMSGDCTIVASGVVTCTKTGGVAFAASATTNTTNAANITSGTLPAARVSSFAPVLLNTVSGTTLSDTTSLTASFSEYDIEFQNIVPNTNAVTLVLQLQSGGTFQTTSYVSTILEINSANTAAGVTITITTGVPLSSPLNANNTGQGCSGHLHIVNPSSAAVRKTAYGQLSCSNSGIAARTAIVAGYWDGGNGAITGVQVSPSSGTITSGTMKIYGVP